MLLFSFLTHAREHVTLQFFTAMHEKKPHNYLHASKKTKVSNILISNQFRRLLFFYPAFGSEIVAAIYFW
jgi:hypothetical protein